MIDSTDTSSQFELIPEGHYKLKVVGTPEKFRTNKSTYRKWTFVASQDGIKGRKITAIFFPWESHDLLLALGGKKDEGNKNTIIWNDEEVDGKIIEADIKHGEYEKQDGTKGEKYIFENVQEGLPF